MSWLQKGIWGEKLDQTKTPWKTNREGVDREGRDIDTENEGTLREMGETKRRQTEESQGPSKCQGEEQSLQCHMQLRGQGRQGERYSLALTIRH